MIKRKIFSELKSHLDKKEIAFIVGPRQAGKTTLMMLLKSKLDEKNKKTLFLNLDIEADRRFFTSQEQLLKKIELEIGSSEGYVFIDEIQRKENAGLFLKGIYDMNLPYKLIVSGSGSVELKEKIHESLAGRKRMFELSTISFVEYVNHKTDYKYESSLLKFLELEPEKTKYFLDDYLGFGGYPRVILEETSEEKHKIMTELYQSYLERDIAYLLGVQKTESFTALVRLIASQVGALTNITEVSNTLGISAQTIKDYLWYMQKTFLINKVTPFFKNIRKEITKTPVYYFYDLGMRNYALGAYGTASPTNDSGLLFQNFVYNLLKEKVKYSASKIHFWRTTDKAEVDFIIDNIQEVIPLEVKYKKITKPALSRSYHSFIAKYKPKNGYVIHLGEEFTLNVKGTKINFLPYYKFLFQTIS